VEEEEAIGSKLSDGQKLEVKYRKHIRPSGAQSMIDVNVNVKKSEN
jgi:hypothetical protein